MEKENETERPSEQDTAQFIEALLKRTNATRSGTQAELDKIVGFVRGKEPMTVAECIDAKNRSGMLFYDTSTGYCLCSRFYKCRFQSDTYDVIEGKEKLRCVKYEV
jgi:hypothetical protein